MSKKRLSKEIAINRHTKQMKVVLSIQEHVVVTAAANMNSMNVCDYMKRAVIEQAKVDAKEMSKIIESI